ncbi:hypothetical protein PseudUWO311_00615 [Pseudanabaena sp. UWO311]|uniref:hypothetical protein n=1 Tax=Pseudanabaena sp. UWO311 TaxID=2487337 RepID=UPI001159047C|nr:hypothetical protein [Pseudanabaena sp. UWO311]TYQ29433.1 hypothetical protein PseudUWO311_00615 [Pseudanabaena sp. UWO311]
MLTIFEKIERGHVNLSDTNNDKDLIMFYLKQAYNEGIQAGKEEVRVNMDNIYRAIYIFLENGNEEFFDK